MLGVYNFGEISSKCSKYRIFRSSAKKTYVSQKISIKFIFFCSKFFFAGVKKTKDKDVSLKTKLRDMKNNGVSTTVVFMENTSLL